MSIFSPAEMERRRRRLQEGLAERGLSAAFIHTADNVYYLSGVPLLSEWGRPMWAVIAAGGPGAVIGAALELENIERHSALSEALTYADEENVHAAATRLAADFLRSHGAPRGRVGCERALMPVGLLEALQAQLPEVEWVDVGDLLAALRLVKSPEEIRLLRIGAEVARIGAAAFLEAVQENVPELTVAAHAVREMDRALAALYPEGFSSTYAYCQFGDHTLTPHLHPSGRRLRRGELVALNVFPVVSGYCMELERTFIYGDGTEEQQRALAAVNEAFAAAKEAVRPGAVMGEIDRLARELLTQAGYGAFIRHGTGHAHGIMIGSASREEPGELRVYNRTRLAPGMINSVEPGVYIPGVGGFRHSDVLLITETGAECLTEFPRDLGLPA